MKLIAAVAILALFQTCGHKKGSVPSLHGEQTKAHSIRNDVYDAKEGVGRARRYSDQIDDKLIRLEKGQYDP